jgi:hypothetical protein
MKAKKTTLNKFSTNVYGTKVHAYGNLENGVLKYAHNNHPTLRDERRNFNAI